jgi:cell division protein FtsW
VVNGARLGYELRATEKTSRIVKLAVTILVFCVAALLALGMVMLYSSSMAQAGAHDLVRQLIWCALGLLSCLAAAALDYRWLKKIAWPMLAFVSLLLALVLDRHLGARINGSSRWFIIMGMSVQPSELAKLALVLVLAWYGEHFQRQMPTLKRGILLPGVFIGLVVGLIMIEPDFGNGLLLTAVSGIMLFVAGIRWRFFLPPLLLGILAVGLFLQHNQMRSERIYSWRHVEETKLGKGKQAYEAMVALGSGGITGKGLGDSRQKLGFLPEQQSDFIFAIIGEELGLIATLLVIAAFVAIVYCGVYIAWNASDTFGLLLGVGITSLIGLQAFINIGVVSGALPNKGLPLPFISQGGSNLAILLTGIGLLLSIARKARASSGLLEDLRNRQKANPFAKRNDEDGSEIRNPEAGSLRMHASAANPSEEIWMQLVSGSSSEFGLRTSWS